MGSSRILVAWAAIAAYGLVTGSAARAAEGGSSHYLPGAGGDIFLATPPQPGFQLANTLWFQSGDVGAAVAQGQVESNLNLDLFLNLTSLTYTFEQPVLGGTYTLGAMLPIGYGSLDGTVAGPGGGQVGFSTDSFDISDMAFIPVQLNWTVSDWSFRLSETIIAPTGGYDTAEKLNLGRNYWSFDTAAAVTWFNADSGTEVSVMPGIMLNTENDATDYRTGTEFHVDFTANQFLAAGFAVGLRGYYYRQLSGDSGAGARLGDFKSESFGLGPGFMWVPPIGGGKLSILGKWMHDFNASRRFESDYFTLTGAWKF